MDKGYQGLALMALVALSGMASAALHNRGDGLIYDDVLNVTWQQNANLAASNTFGLVTGVSLGLHPSDTSGFAGKIYSNGVMNWPGALFWIDAMNAANYKGYNDWRLPAMMDTGSTGCTAGYNGTDCGYNVQTGSAATIVFSEMASLFYDTLGNTAYFDTDGIGPQLGWGLQNMGLFENLQSYYYWTGLEYEPLTDQYVWAFDFNSGGQDAYLKEYFLPPFAWAVRTGDVIGQVPVPMAAWLFGSALFALLGVVRSRR